MSEVPAEIELKFAIAPDDTRALRAASPLASTKPRRQKLVNLYFDTPDRTLAGAGMALRLRKAGRRWVQTLKGRGMSTGGLHARGEWEHARAEPTLDLSLLEGTPLGKLQSSADLARALANTFTVEFQRETWIVESGRGTRLEVALDRGEVRSGERTEAVCEVEIEVLEGRPEEAFALARRLQAEVALRPSTVTKAERGDRLARNASREPAKARRVELDPAMDAGRAARAIVAGALEHLQANEEGLLATDGPEFVHQARVALRRLRSALRQFRDELHDARTEAWREQLGDVARALGEARDWDVFTLETLPPVARAFGDARIGANLRRRAQARRKAGREAAREVVRSPAYARLLLDLAAWVSEAPAATAAPRESIAELASRLVRKRHRKLLADARNLAKLPPEARHQVRIDAKRLRYCVDGFASLFKEGKVSRYGRALSGLQDALGRANDAATATARLAELAPPPAFAEFARGYLAARTQEDVAMTADLVDALASAKRFWLEKPADDAGTPGDE